MQTSVGIMQGRYDKTVQACIFGINENDHVYQYVDGVEVDQGNSCAVFMAHEVSHALYLIQNRPDNTHTYFYSNQASKVLDDLRDGALNKAMQLIAYMKQLVLLLTTAINQQKIMEKKTYLWDTPDLARHSVRLICDEEGLSVADKNDLCATVGAESGWKPGAIGKPNTDGSIDYGIAQINDKTWVGPGMKFPNTQYVLDNPELCIRWMCKQWKLGHKNWWYGYKFGAYKKYL